MEDEHASVGGAFAELHTCRFLTCREFIAEVNPSVRLASAQRAEITGGEISYRAAVDVTHDGDSQVVYFAETRLVDLECGLFGE